MDEHSFFASVSVSSSQMIRRKSRRNFFFGKCWVAMCLRRVKFRVYTFLQNPHTCSFWAWWPLVLCIWRPLLVILTGPLCQWKLKLLLTVECRDALFCLNRASWTGSSWLTIWCIWKKSSPSPCSPSSAPSRPARADADASPPSSSNLTEASAASLVQAILALAQQHQSDRLG